MGKWLVTSNSRRILNINYVTDIFVNENERAVIACLPLNDSEDDFYRFSIYENKDIDELYKWLNDLYHKLNE